MARPIYLSEFIHEVSIGNGRPVLDEEGIGRFAVSFKGTTPLVTLLIAPKITESRRFRELGIFNRAVDVLRTHFPEVKTHYSKAGYFGYFAGYQGQMTYPQFQQVEGELKTVRGIKCYSEESKYRSSEALDELLLRVMPIPK